MKFFTDPEITKVEWWYKIQSSLTEKMQDMIEQQAIQLDYAILKWCSDETLKELISKAETELYLRKTTDTFTEIKK